MCTYRVGFNNYLYIHKTGKQCWKKEVGEKKTEKKFKHGVITVIFLLSSVGHTSWVPATATGSVCIQVALEKHTWLIQYTTIIITMGR